MTAAAVIQLRGGPASRLAAKLRNEDGVGLIELLIAVLVLNVGIFATIGAFTSAGAAIRRASRISTAAAIADQKVETLHNQSYANIVSSAATNTTGADGRTYSVQVAVTTGSQMTSGTYQGSSSVKVVTVTVRDVADGNKLLDTTLSTFSRCNQSGLQSDTGNTPCQS